MVCTELPRSDSWKSSVFDQTTKSNPMTMLKLYVCELILQWKESRNLWSLNDHSESIFLQLLQSLTRHSSNLSRFRYKMNPNKDRRHKLLVILVQRWPSLFLWFREMLLFSIYRFSLRPSDTITACCPGVSRCWCWVWPPPSSTRSGTWKSPVPRSSPRSCTTWTRTATAGKYLLKLRLKSLSVIRSSRAVILFYFLLVKTQSFLFEKYIILKGAGGYVTHAQHDKELCTKLWK